MADDDRPILVRYRDPTNPRTLLRIIDLIWVNYGV